MMKFMRKGIPFFLLGVVALSTSAFADSGTTTTTTTTTTKHHAIKHHLAHAHSTKHMQRLAMLHKRHIAASSSVVRHRHNYKGEGAYHDYKQTEPMRPTAGYKGESDYKAMAVAPPVLTTKTDGNFEVIAALGLANVGVHGSSELGVTSSESDRLVSNGGSNSWNTFAAQLGLGYVYYLGDSQQSSDQLQWFPSVEPEINLYYLGGNGGTQGDVWRFDSASFNNLTYKVPVHSTRLMLDAALTLASWDQFSVYIKGGLGDSWNRVSYTDTNNSDSFPEATISLNSKTTSHFVWEGGAGLNYAFQNRFALSLEYLYADLGSANISSTGSSGGITFPVLVAPHFNKIRSQTVLLGLHIPL